MVPSEYEQRLAKLEVEAKKQDRRIEQLEAIVASQAQVIQNVRQAPSQ